MREDDAPLHRAEFHRHSSRAGRERKAAGAALTHLYPPPVFQSGAVRLRVLNCGDTGVKG